MNKTISWCLIIAITIIVVILSFKAPWVLSDQNIFLKNFVNHEILNFLGVIVAITIGSIANLHLELNKLEEQIKKEVFTGTRSSLKRSIYCLIGTLVITIILAVIKPLIVKTSLDLMVSSFVNGFALIVVFVNILTLIDILQATFKVKPNYD